MVRLITFLLLFNILLASSQTVTVVTTSNWEPFNMIRNHKLEGIGVDFWKLVAKKADINYTFKIVNRWCDVLDEIRTSKAALTLSADITKDRLKYAVFSKPYVVYPLVIATRNDIGFIFDIRYLKNKKIAVGKNYTAAKMMSEKYPFFNYIFVHSTDEALNLVKNKEVFAAVDILPVIAYKITKYQYKDLKISGQVPINFKVRFMLAKPYEYLLPKINKAIDEITYKEKENIYLQYVKPPQKLFITSNEALFYVLIAGSVLIMIVLWIYMLINELRSLKEKQTLDYSNECDRLTGIYNSPKIKEFIKDRLQKNEKFSLIVFDINDFKSINRFYGHHFGDITLLELVSLVKASLGENDIFGRLKGGTFVIIVNETEAEACEKARAFYEKIESFEFSIVNKIKCTFIVKTVYKKEDADTLMFQIEKELTKCKKKSQFFRC